MANCGSHLCNILTKRISLLPHTTSVRPQHHQSSSPPPQRGHCRTRLQRSSERLNTPSRCVRSILGLRSWLRLVTGGCAGAGVGRAGRQASWHFEASPHQLNQPPCNMVLPPPH